MEFFIHTGTTHADDLMYMFNAPYPIILCPKDEFFCK